MKVFIVKLIFPLANNTISVIRKILFFKKKLPNHPNKILIYRIGQIGDIICSIPAMIAVKDYFDRARVTLLSTPVGRNMPGAKELLNGADFLDEMIVYYQDEIQSWRGILSLIKRLRKNRYDLFIELPNDLGRFKIFFRNMLFARIIGCKYGLGFQINTLKIFCKQQKQNIQFKNEVKRLIELLASEGIHTKEITFRLPIQRQDILTVNKIFAEYGIKKNDFCIAINPGAKRFTNRWSREQYTELGKALSEYYNAWIWITGGSGEAELANLIAEKIGERAISIAGRTSLLQSAEILRRCKLLITNDTGTMHLAVAMETPVVAIFSARYFPDKWYPYGQNNIVLRKSLNCEICFKERCDHLTCLNLISVDEVINACHKILMKHPARCVT